MCRLLRSFAAFTCLLLLSGLGLVMTAAPASASVTFLCKGYAGCLRAGMSSSGYAQANGTMYWRMYSGHNCTNYVAYRMVKSGLPNVRPWSGDGNAKSWGPANPALTNGTPEVGAVAWYRANYGLAGGAGHVAYVEQVVSPDEIIISEDNWGGDFYWVRVTRTSGAWPSGFIHFNDVRVTNLTAPTVSGDLKVGSTLTATTGAWNLPGLAFTYEWRASGTVLAGATGPTLSLTPDLLGKRIKVRVTASRLGYPSAVQGSAPSSAVQPGTIVSTAPPTVTGTDQVPYTLTATPGSWNVATDAVAYQWTADGVAIPGATGPKLRLRGALAGKAIAVSVTASKATYLDTTVSSATGAPVAPGTFRVRQPARLDYPVPGSKKVQVGQRLTVEAPTVGPTPGAVTVQWYRGGTPIEGATDPSYTVSTADLGSRLSPVVSVTRTGFTPVTSEPGATWLVRTTPRIRLVTLTRKPGQLRVTVRVAAHGVSPVTGTVQVLAGGKDLGELTLRNGQVSRPWHGLPSGPLALTVRYGGSPSTTVATASRTVHIR